jgi:hypothetical protein
MSLHSDAVATVLNISQRTQCELDLAERTARAAMFAAQRRAIRTWTEPTDPWRSVLDLLACTLDISDDGVNSPTLVIPDSTSSVLRAARAAGMQPFGLYLDCSCFFQYPDSKTWKDYHDAWVAAKAYRDRQCTTRL